MDAEADTADVELMKRLAGGDDLALNTIMVRWQQRVASFLYRLNGNRQTAIDLAQDSFVRLYHARHRYRPEGTFSTYLFAIALNLARNHARWLQRHPTVQLDSDEATGASTPLAKTVSPADTLAGAEILARVEAAFRELPADLREALTLFIHEDLGYADIARIAGCSTKAAETRIYRARQILKETLRDLHHPPKN